MTVEEAIRDRLLDTAGVTDLVSTRVWQLVLPQTPTLPAIRVQLIDQPRRAHLRGFVSVFRSRVQVDAFARGGDAYGSVAAIADAMDAALTPEPFSAGSPSVDVLAVYREDRRPFFEPDEIDAVRMMTDYLVWHRAA